MLYTSLPIVIYSVFDYEYMYEHLIKTPLLYVQGMKGLLFNVWEFWFWVIQGLVQALLIAVFCFFVFDKSLVGGHMMFLASSGMLSYGISVILGNLKILLFSKEYSFGSLVIIFGSILLFVLNYYMFSIMTVQSDIYGTFTNQYASAMCYLVILVVIGCTFLLDLAITQFREKRYKQQLLQQQ